MICRCGLRGPEVLCRSGEGVNKMRFHYFLDTFIGLSLISVLGLTPANARQCDQPLTDEYVREVLTKSAGSNFVRITDFWYSSKKRVCNVFSCSEWREIDIDQILIYASPEGSFQRWTYSDDLEDKGHVHVYLSRDIPWISMGVGSPNNPQLRSSAVRPASEITSSVNWGWHGTGTYVAHVYETRSRAARRPFKPVGFLGRDCIDLVDRNSIVWTDSDGNTMRTEYEIRFSSAR